MFGKVGAFFLDILEVVVFAVGIFFFVYLLIMRPHKIKGQSMHPNFPDGEYLLTEKVTYYTRSPKRGDVVVFTPPISETDEFIKRIIGTSMPMYEAALKFCLANKTVSSVIVGSRNEKQADMNFGIVNNKKKLAKSQLTELKKLWVEKKICL